MSSRKLSDYFILSLKGLAMGAADVVPGVSGGTIAFISGIYEELITTISNINLSLFSVWKNEGFSAMWKKLNGNFIFALFSGILISVFTVMRLANYLLENHPILIWSFFFGLVLASVWFMARQVPKWSKKTIFAFVFGAIVAFYITTLASINSGDSLWYMFLAGAIAICAMILPGISGAFILVLLGAYKTISAAIHDFDIKIILVFGLGTVVGLLSFSKALKWLLTKHHSITISLLTGFIAGSLNKIWPWKDVLETLTVGDKIIPIKEISVWPTHFNGDPLILYSVLLMLFGFVLIFGLEKLAVNKTP